MKEQQYAEMKKNLKAIEKINRIVIQGRKVLEIPLKNKKKKKKVIIKDNDNEIFNYSSDEK